MITQTRRQHPVGQGLFHSSEVRFGEDPFADHHPRSSEGVDLAGDRLRYVYDCGVYQTLPRASLNREVDRLIDICGGPGSRLDFVFLSHAHADHMNGLTRLLHPTRGLRADALVLPRIDAIERLVAAAAAGVEAQDSGLSSTDAADAAGSADVIARFVSDPEASDALNVDRVIFAEPGDDGVEIQELSGELGPEGEPEGGITWYVDGARSGIALDGIGRVTKGARFVVSSRANPSSSRWTLIPHVAAAVEDGRAEFEVALARELERDVDELRRGLRDPVYVTEIIRDHPAELTAAYKVTAPDKQINATCLSLYSGPVDGGGQSEICLHVGDGTSRPRLVRRGGVGWLGTGDSEFDRPGYLADLLSTLGSYQAEVGTITVPHHGSGDNRVSGLWESFPALGTCVTTADPQSTGWLHPATEIVIEIASHGLDHVIVTSDERSFATEYVAVET